MDNFELEFGALTHLAAGFHVQQTRKGSSTGLRVPYIIHPLQVLRRVQMWGIKYPSDENKVFWKALLFHDAIEDTSMTYEFLVGLIGKAAADIVFELSHVPGEDKNLFMRSFNTKSIEAVVGKIADRLCNVEDFLVDNAHYAKKYYHKADDVFAVFDDRYDEVISRFGNEAAKKILENYRVLGNTVESLFSPTTTA